MLRQAEFDFDNSVWNLPPEKVKMRGAHRAPFSTQVRALLEELWEFTGTGRYCFPSFRTDHRPMSENTVNAALRVLGFSLEEMCAHGFRAIAATLLNESGRFHPDAIERQLANVERDGVRRAYTRGKYWSERITMMQWQSTPLSPVNRRRFAIHFLTETWT